MRVVIFTPLHSAARDSARTRSKYAKQASAYVGRLCVCAFLADLCLLPAEGARVAPGRRPLSYVICLISLPPASDYAVLVRGPDANESGALLAELSDRARRDSPEGLIRRQQAVILQRA